MKLNHVNLPSSDIDADIALLETFFGFRLLQRRGRAVAILRDDGGLTLVINDLPKLLGDFAYPQSGDVLHVGFHLDSREEVDATHAQLTAGGWTVPAPHDLHGAWTFYLKAPGGFTIEIFHQPQAR